MIATLMFASTSLIGCLCDPDYCKMPNLLHPGHINRQQAEMQRFDPYCRTDVGPKITGDRPHGADFQTPIDKQLDDQRKRNGY